MLLILVEVSVNVSENEQTQCRSYGLHSNIWTEGTDTCTRIGNSPVLAIHDSHRAITMLLILVEVSVKVSCRSTTATDCGYRAITMLLILIGPR